MAGGGTESVEIIRCWPPAEQDRPEHLARGGVQGTTECRVSDELVLHLRDYSNSAELEVTQDVQYQCVYCSIQADNENITVAAELSLINADQFLKRRIDLLIPGKITFNRQLYQGLKEEEHSAEITLIFLKEEVFDPVPIVIGSSVGGLLLLLFIILLLWKDG